MCGTGSEDGRWEKQEDSCSVAGSGIGDVKPKAAGLQNKALAVRTDICLVTLSCYSRLKQVRHPNYHFVSTSKMSG
jgi:hypothetical protein